jgi:hypothetical protein
MTPYPDSQEAYEACCLGFDQAKVVLDGEQYTTAGAWWPGQLRKAAHQNSRL